MEQKRLEVLTETEAEVREKELSDRRLAIAVELQNGTSPTDPLVNQKIDEYFALTRYQIRNDPKGYQSD